MRRRRLLAEQEKTKGLSKEDVSKYLIGIASGVISGSAGAAVAGTIPAVAGLIGVTTALAVSSSLFMQYQASARKEKEIVKEIRKRLEFAKGLPEIHYRMKKITKRKKRKG